MLEEFYVNLRTVGVSAITGEGIAEFFAAVEEGRQEYDQMYRPRLEARQKASSVVLLAWRAVPCWWRHQGPKCSIQQVD